MLNKNSHEWVGLKQAILERIEETRDRLEAASDIGETNRIRGQIAGYRDIIDMVEIDNAPLPGQSVSYMQK